MVVMLPTRSCQVGSSTLLVFITICCAGFEKIQSNLIQPGLLLASAQAMVADCPVSVRVPVIWPAVIWAGVQAMGAPLGPTSLLPEAWNG